LCLAAGLWYSCLQQGQWYWILLGRIWCFRKYFLGKKKPNKHY